MSQWARNNPEEARLAARRADIAMEAYQLRPMEEHTLVEPDPDPLVEAIWCELENALLRQLIFDMAEPH